MPSIKTLAALFFALSLAACLPGAGGTDGANGSNGSGTNGSGTNGENGGGGDGGGTTNGSNNGGNEPEPVPYCYIGCTAAADCTAMENGAFSENNYACTAGACEYTGCNSDDECAETFAATGLTYLCRDPYNTGISYCQPACSVAADCVNSAPGFEEANYSCTDGVCRYEGCTTDEQCETRYATTEGNWGCRELNGFTDCRQLCTTNADCGILSAQDAWDSDNYTCNAEGICEYAGCNSDAECNTGGVSGQVCQTL